MSLKEFKNDFLCNPNEIKKTREKAYATLKKLLEEKKVNDEDFKDGETIITYFGNKNNIGVSFGFQKTDDNYYKFSGVRSILICANFFTAKQPKSFGNIEMGIITMAMELAPTKKEKIEIINKYAKPYNDKIKQKNMQ